MFSADMRSPTSAPPACTSVRCSAGSRAATSWRVRDQRLWKLQLIGLRGYCISLQMTASVTVYTLIMFVGCLSWLYHLTVLAILNTTKRWQYNQWMSLPGGSFYFFLVTLPVRSRNCSANEHVEEFLGHFGSVQKRKAIYLQCQRQHPLEDRHYSAGGWKRKQQRYIKIFSEVAPQGYMKVFNEWKMNEPHLFFRLSGCFWCLRLLRWFWNGSEQPLENIPDKHTRLKQDKIRSLTEFIFGLFFGGSFFEKVKICHRA